MRSDKERLQDILEAIAQVERYATPGRDRFNQDELVQIWIVHHLQIIGEASSKLSKVFTDQHPEIPWAAVVEFRNILVHEYFRVDLEIVWRIVEHDLPDLKSRVQAFVQQGENE
ncbi:MAG: HepT-like ribonuclease domain-containing protein [Oculatellaceae cyanobacterium bins.114]|nr:HepT-like ribonuclease domain-containing protein [Oculatellaceae cyanobacterium bins.114]